MKYLLPGVALLCVACTPGSFGIASSGSATGITGQIVTIDVDLTRDPSGSTPGGTGAGYAPLVTTLAVGDGVRFHNSDGFAHTATAVPGDPPAFPTAYPFARAALNQSGTRLSDGFSSGNLTAGSMSQTLLADQPGTYLFGCFYHYGSPMRASIVVR
jgi:plastocyanin